MEHLEYKKSVNGVCHTSCPYHNDVMIGSAKCEDCIYCAYLMPNGEKPYVKCRFKEFADEKKDTQMNNFGNRLKLKVWKEDSVNSDIGYIDGYVQNGNETLAIVYVPNRKELITLSIDDITIINEGE